MIFSLDSRASPWVIFLGSGSFSHLSALKRPHLACIYSLQGPSCMKFM